MANCDICGAETSRAKSPTYKADDIRRIASNGFTPDESIVDVLSQAGSLSREQVLAQWEQKVAQATTDWLLCPACVSRVAGYYRQSDKRHISKWWYVAGVGVLLAIIAVVWLIVSAPKATWRSLRGPTTGVIGVAFSPDSKLLVSLADDTAAGGADRMMLVWDVAAGREMKRLEEYASRMTSLAFSPDGRFVALGGNEATIQLLDATTWQEARRLSGHEMGITALAFSADGQTLVSASHDTTVRLWAVSTGQEASVLRGFDTGVTSVAFSPDGGQVAGGSGDGTIILWDAKTGQVTYTLNAHQKYVSSLTFSPDGRTLASASHDARVKLWDAATGQEIRTLGIHPRGANSVTFSPDGQMLASGGEDGAIKVWNPATGQEVSTIRGYRDYPVTSLAFSADGKLLASGNWFDAKLWEISAQSMATPWPTRTPHPIAFPTSTVIFQSSTSQRPTATPLPDDIQQALDQLPRGERWQMHLSQDLLPFWEMETALGQPVGNFPTYRCNDGSLYDRAKPCIELQASWLRLDRDYVRMKSRQTFAYGVAYHLTGDETYLKYAAAGVDYLRSHALDRENGGAYTYWLGKNRAPGPAVRQRTAQDLAYALTGMSFYYYLTRDEAVLKDILDVKEYIFTNYYDADSDLLKWVIENSPDGDKINQKELVAQLDQVNGYMLLLTPALPEPYRSEWEQELLHLSRIMMAQFYSPEQNMFWGTLTNEDSKRLGSRHTDFGHSIKAFWMIYQTGKLTSNSDLISFAGEGAARLLEKAYIGLSDSWARNLSEDGDLDTHKEWWIYAELDQGAATLALQDLALAVYLPETYDYWFTYMVDHKSKEVWFGINATNDQPWPDSAKQHFWKNAYHSFEHTLVGYITSQQLHNEPVQLYYAFKQVPDQDTIRPYFYSGSIAEIRQVPGETFDTLYQVTFTDVR